jgi:benzil reductase ((S)-benzoin forming)
MLRYAGGQHNFTMSLNREGKLNDIHVVTGASSGVGLALSRHLAGQGHHVLAVARRQSELEALRSEQPQQIDILSTDLGSEEGRRQVVEAVDGRFNVKSLVHSAAIATKGYLKDLSMADYRQLMAINVEAPLFLTQLLLPAMPTGARVLQLSSGSAHRTMEYNGLYSISKAALLMSYRAWNADFPKGEIIVGSAMPGVVEGPMQDAAREGDHPSAQVFRDFEQQGRLIRPERVAEFLHWLLFGTSDQDFSSQDWNIFDESHHGNWLQGPLSG